MKRKRTPSPASVSQRRNSRSPLSPRSTRTTPRTPPENGEKVTENEQLENGQFSIRRSSRARRLSYPSYHPGFMAQDDVIRNREQHAKESMKNGNSRRRNEGRSRSSSPDSEDMNAPFFHHVRFSPSAKPSSPARRHRQRAAASIAKMRLQNVPSEDEQSEFNRRYSRDLRSRRQQERSDPSNVTETHRKSRTMKTHDSNSEEEDNKVEEDTTPRRSGRSANRSGQNEDAEDEESEAEAITSSNIRRVTRRGQPRSEPEESEAPDEPMDDEDEPLGRRSRRAAEENGETSQPRIQENSPSTEFSIRRSARTPKPTMKTKAESSDEHDENDDDDGEVEESKPSRSSRPKRSRAPVERFGYSAPQERSVSRRRSNEVRNLDQYSTNDEFQGDDDDDDDDMPSSRRRKKYNMRTKKRKPSSYRSRDTSSSSSSESVDEQRFAKRKNKRMMIERSKLRPVNMSKHDATKAIFKERQAVGASMADVQPMEMDMGVTFESVGGVDGHINSLREMVIFPLLYPEIFTKFSMTPPRGVLFYGPPGTGKTLIARALAAECSREGRKVAFFMRKGADCLSKWIGESERQLRLLFDQAYLMRPSIIFFDEIDGLAPVRSSRNDQIHSSIVSTLLALMDGLDNRGEIIVIGATNRIENIDPALRRPGRFDRELRFALPTRDSRRAILDLHTNKWSPPVEESVIDLLADKTIGYSGADLKGLCAEAALIALRRRYPQVYKTSQKLALDFDQIKITNVDFELAMERLVPSTHRIQDQCQSPLVPRLRPLLSQVVEAICQKIDEVNSKEFSYRPRVLIQGRPGQCISTYIGPAILHHLEKLPCHKLDIPSLFSNSARSPEEAMFHIIHEAKRTVPSVLYIPHLLRLWRKVLNDPQREAFLAMLSEIQPTAPLIIIAFTEELTGEDGDEIIEDMFDADNEIIQISNADTSQRRLYFKPVFDAALDPPEEDDKKRDENCEVLQVLPIPESRELTEKEEKRLRRKEDSLLRELRIFLRDVWQKINREQKFFMFRVAVDTEEVYDYEDYVQTPMHFDLMLSKLDGGQYHCAQDFLNDIDLIADNAIKYNSDLNYETNKIICHRARALQDFAYALVKAEMETDFEDNCKEIVSRRKKLTEKLSKPQEVTAFDPKTNEIVQVPLDQSTAEHDEAKKSSAKKKKPKKKSRWSSGFLTKRPKAKPKDSPPSSEQAQANNGENLDTSAVTDMEQDHAEDSGSDEEVTLNESKELKIDIKKLRQIEDDVVKRTEGFDTENLERIFTKLMECVAAYKTTFERAQLPQDMLDKLDSLKILPQKSTPARKKTATP